MDPAELPSSMDKKAIYLKHCERRYKRGNEVVIQLNHKLDDLYFRYDKALKENQRSFKYSLRLKISVLEGVIHRYADYVQENAHIIEDLRREMFGETVQLFFASDTPDSESDGGNWAQQRLLNLMTNGSCQSHQFFFRKDTPITR